VDHSYFPVFLDLEGAPVLVVGAGRVALRKVRSLCARGARVTVVAKDFKASVRRLVADGAVRGIASPFRPNHVTGMRLVFAATDDQDVNRAVSKAARARNIPVNVADAPGDCSFILPAAVEEDDFTLAVSTGGRNPGTARAIREFLEEHRAEIAVRVERGRRRPAIRSRPGTVFIVGAGPGDPDLLTVRALGLLRSADVVIHDYLIPEAILSLTKDAAKRICYARRGRTGGHGAAIKQRAIHEAMVRFAREGHSVVRLKSGDPLVFGRGGEEASYLARADIPFEIVPGITAAIGCAAAANLPLTRRDLASSITFIAGHEAEGKDGSAVDWSRLPVGGTIAVYMGVAQIGAIARGLAQGGFPPDTPFAVVENGTRRNQRIIRGTLADLLRIAEKTGIRSPAVLFVGRSAAAAAAAETNQERDHGPVAQSI
jgi:uroporphyrin-III C-methyltransferase / precorrin-2 dehydrogenase / sirohydrochlorin ferrochelatase